VEPKRKKSSSLSVKVFPPELLDRVNAKAALLGIDQSEFVIACLDRATKELQQVRADIKQRWEREGKD
jgi:hypothetical protein